MSDGDVAIVAMACVFPGAAGVRSFWRNVATGRAALTRMPSGRWPRGAGDAPETPGGFVPAQVYVDVLRHRITPNVVRYGDQDQFLLLELAAAALDQAGVTPDDPVRRRTDVIVGHGVYGSAKMSELWFRVNGAGAVGELAARGAIPDELADSADAAIVDLLPPEDVDGLASVIPNFVASRTANRLDLGGAAYVVDAACASTLVAIEQAVDRLRVERADLALVGGINFSHAPHFWHLFSRIGALSPSGVIRPYDRAGDGLLIGEGAGVLVLKRLADAQRDGDHVVAVVKGVGSSSDGAATGILAPAADGQMRALARAYDDAGVDPATVTLLEGHGTATVLGDATELHTIATFYGPPAGPYATRVLGSVKSMIGHTMPAAGAASVIKAAAALSARVLPPSLGCDEPHPALADTAFFVPGRPRPWARGTGAPPRRAGVNAFGFGGINSHVVLEEAPPPPARRGGVPVPAVRRGGVSPSSASTGVGVARPTELVAASGPSVAHLAERLATLADLLDAGARLEDVAATAAARVVPGQPHGVAVLCRDDGSAAARLREVGRFDGHAVDDTWTLTPGRDPGKLAVLFPPLLPGLSGPVLDRIVEQCVHLPAARAVLDAVEAKDGRPDDPMPTSLLLAPPPHIDPAQRRRWRARFDHSAAAFAEPYDPAAADGRNLSMLGALTAACASWRVLERLGVTPDALCGFSMGEVAALVGVGAATVESATAQGWAAFAGLTPDVRGGAMLSVPQSAAALADLLELHADVGVALALLPELTLLGGPRAALDDISARLADRGVTATAVPSLPIHTAYYAEHAERVRAALRGVVVGPLEGPPVYAADVAEQLPVDPEAAEAAVAGNFFRPVRVWETLARLHDDGVRTFVQAGPGAVADLVERVRPGGTGLATVVAGVHPVTQLQRVCGHLFGEGRTLDLSGLYDGRATRIVDDGMPLSAPARGSVALRLAAGPWMDDGGADGVRSTGPHRGARGGTMPFLGDVSSFVPGRRLTSTVAIDPARHRYLDDHEVFRELRTVKRHARLAIMPLTMVLELLAEPSAMLAPGRGLTGFSAVRARRHIGPDGTAIQVEVDARVASSSGDEVTVDARALVDGHVAAQARVHFAPSYRQTLGWTFAPPAPRTPLPISGAELYEQGHLFHGPLFRCIADAGERYATGNRAELMVLPRDGLFADLPDAQLLIDPLTLDGVGQAASLFFFGRAITMPIGIDRLELYRPTPPTGTRLPVRSQWHRPDPGLPVVSASIEVGDGAGGVWLRAAGWQDRLWEVPAHLAPGTRDPFCRTLAQVHVADGAVTASFASEDFGALPNDWVARVVLSSAEEEHVAQPGGRPDQRRWLAARVALKDAVRVWLARTEGERRMRHAVQVTIGGSAAAPVVTDVTPPAALLPDVRLHVDGDRCTATASAPRYSDEQDRR